MLPRVEAVEMQPSWTRPVAVIVAVGLFLTLFTAFAANVDTIQGWFGRAADVPVSLSIQTGKLVRPDNGSLVVAISYKKAGQAPLHDCKFLMDTGEVVLPGEIPEFNLAAGPSTRDLQVQFRLAAQRALNSPSISLILSCDDASSVAIPLNVRTVPVAGQ
jgi:hypothetical protein